MLLELKRVSAGYGRTTAITDIDLTVRSGEVIGLIGPNGSGKSTLLKCVANIVRPRAGSVVVDGRDLREIPARQVARRIAYIPQAAGAATHLTVLDAVELGRAPHAGIILRERDREQVREVLRIMKLERFAFRRLGELSGGERQLVLIARALVQEAELILLDEPTSALDLRHQLEVSDLISTFRRERGMAFIVAMHDLNLVQRFADRMHVLSRGKTAAAGPPGTTLTAAVLRSVYEVHAEVRRHGDTVQVIPLRPATSQDDAVQ